MGVSFYELENYEKAIETFDKALEINPNLEEALINKSVCLNMLGETDAQQLKLLRKL